MSEKLAEVERLQGLLRCVSRDLAEEIQRLTSERDKARAEAERLREALQGSACACSSLLECVSEWARDGYCPHVVARRALEAKP